MPDLSADNRTRLIDALGEAQRIGMLGDRPLNDVINHSLGFVQALSEQAQSVIDLGSGGGDPGLVVAVACPHLAVTLVDRRAKRTDLLMRLVGRLGLRERVEVIEADVEDVPLRCPGRTWDAVTCRGFGPPEYTARLAVPLMAPGGQLLISEPPNSDGSRWRTPDVARSGATFVGMAGSIAILGH